MQKYRIDEAKAQLDQLIDAALRGETILITGVDQQVVQLLPVGSPHVARKAGSARGQVKISDDFDAPLPDFSEYMK